SHDRVSIGVTTPSRDLVHTRGVSRSAGQWNTGAGVPHTGRFSNNRGRQVKTKGFPDRSRKHHNLRFTWWRRVARPAIGQGPGWTFEREQTWTVGRQILDFPEVRPVLRATARRYVLNLQPRGTIPRTK